MVVGELRRDIVRKFFATLRELGLDDGVILARGQWENNYLLSYVPGERLRIVREQLEKMRF